MVNRNTNKNSTSSALSTSLASTSSTSGKVKKVANRKDITSAQKLTNNMKVLKLIFILCLKFMYPI
jgi:hypothetical protein